MRDIQVSMIDDSEALALVTTKAMHKLITGLGWIDAGRWLNREATLYFRDEVAANATDDKPSRDRFDHVVVAHHDGYADRVARTRDFIEAVSRNTGRSAISLLDGLAADSLSGHRWQECTTPGTQARMSTEPEVVGDKMAEHGDYIVRHPDGSRSVIAAEKFNSLYEIND